MRYLCCLLVFGIFSVLACEEQAEDGARIFDGEAVEDREDVERATMRDNEDNEDEEDEEDHEDAEEEAFLKGLHVYLSEHHPGLNRLLNTAKDQDEELYEEHAEELAWRVHEYKEMESDAFDREEMTERRYQRQRFQLDIKTAELRLGVYLAQRAYEQSKRSDQAAAEKVKTLVPQLFSVLLEAKELELQQLRQETKQLETEVKTLSAQKEKVIQQKIDSLLNQDLLDW